MHKYDPNGYRSRQQVLDAMKNAGELDSSADNQPNKGKGAEKDKTPRKSRLNQSEETK